MIKICLLLLSLSSFGVLASEAPSANVYIISPLNGEEVSSPVAIRFGLSGMGVAPAGVDKPNTCLLYTSPSPRDRTRSRMPSSA